MAEGPVKPLLEHEQAANRILASETFQKAPKLRDLLAFVATHSLKGERDLLSEQQIGIAVFGRAPGYSPGEDSIVRVQVRNLRERLAEYFEGEGAADPIIVTIPKGGYELCFASRHPPAEVAVPERKPLQVPARSAILLLLAFLAGLVARGFWPATPAPREQVTAGAREGIPANPLLRAMFAPSSPTLVVYEDPLAGLASLIRGKPFTLAEYASAAGAPDLGAPGQDATRDRIRQMLPASRSVQLANVTFEARLLRAFPQLSQTAVFKHARDVQLREVKTSNCILFGAQMTNPWMELYEPRLNFRFRGAAEGGGFENRRPEPGEPRVYGEGPREKVAYARIAVLAGFQPESRVLTLTGLGSGATEAAAEFILDPHLLDRVPPELAQELQRLPARVEILLATNQLGSTASSVRVVVWRVADQDFADPPARGAP